jgi:CubicO group peptidase (beta-lactamase class C family)
MRITTFLLALPLLGSAATGQAAALHADDVDARVAGLVDELMQADGAVGLSVAVGVGDEVVVSRGFGLAEVEHGIPADARTCFRIGSITKQFTAAAICRLSERGELHYDDDMKEYVPSFPTQGHTVTIRHLLTHTSGIPSYTAIGPEWQRTVPLELTHEELLGFVAGKPFDFAPGQSYSYNNTGYYLLGVVVEEVADEGYAEYMARELFEPLGLERTRYGSNRDVIENRAQGYQLVDGELANDDPIGMSQPGAAGALLSTAGDLVRWNIALVTGGVVDPATYEEMTLPYMFDDATETSYGFGLSVAPVEGRPCVSHGGGINGFNSMLAHYPEAGLTVAVISNSEAFSAGMVERRIALLLLEE